jgi:hypothetical protein
MAARRAKKLTVCEGPALPFNWHYTTFVDFLDHWQALSAGLLGFFAAIIVVWFTLGIERRKADRELDALRKSLGVELRVIIRSVLVAYNSLMDRTKNKTETDGHILQYTAELPIPIIYRANANRIGLLGPDAMRVVAIYNFIEIARSGITPLARAAVKLPSTYLIAVANPLLSACQQSVPVLQKFRIGDPAYDEIDKKLISEINAASREAAKAATPKPD